MWSVVTSIGKSKFLIADSPVTVGRTHEASLHVEKDQSISRLHAMFTATAVPDAKSPDALLAIKMKDESKFGTWINEQKCTSGYAAAASLIPIVLCVVILIHLCVDRTVYDLKLGDVVRVGAIQSKYTLTYDGDSPFSPACLHIF